MSNVTVQAVQVGDELVIVLPKEFIEHNKLTGESELTLSVRGRIMFVESDYEDPERRAHVLKIAREVSEEYYEALSALAKM